VVVAAVAPDPSGDDRTLIGLEYDRVTGRAGIEASLAAAGFGRGGVILCRGAAALAEVSGFFAAGDSRLADIGMASRPPVVLGAYAVPVGGAA
jgi:chorismate mutase / prephenate dehydratase